MSTPGTSQRDQPIGRAWRAAALLCAAAALVMAGVIGALLFADNGDPAGRSSADAGLRPGTLDTVVPGATRRPGDRLPADAPAFEFCVAVSEVAKVGQSPDADELRRAAWERALQYATGWRTADVRTILDNIGPEREGASLAARERLFFYYAENCRVTIDPPAEAASSTSIRSAATTLPAR